MQYLVRLVSLERFEGTLIAATAATVRADLSVAVDLDADVGSLTSFEVVCLGLIRHRAAALKSEALPHLTLSILRLLFEAEPLVNLLVLWRVTVRQVRSLLHKRLRGAFFDD